MKKITALVIIFLSIQLAQSQATPAYYDSMWKRVQQLEKESMTKSAMELVAQISAKAKKDHQEPQVIKSLLYASKYSMVLEEDAQLEIIEDFKDKIAENQVPVKNILEGYLANLYWQYFQQNRYRFYDRTKTETKIDSADFRTWDLTTLFYEVGKHFDASLNNKSHLQQTPVDHYNEILVKQDDSEIYRPTLFDLLAHNALDFYTSSENSITRPADKFELNNPSIFCNAKEFVQQNITTNDKTSSHFKALQLYQQLVLFHLSDPSLEALVDVDIARLKFIWENAVFPNKDQQYIEVLQNSAETFKENEHSALYRYEIAYAHHQSGNTYHPTINPTPRWKHKEALDICDSIIEQFPSSRAAERCTSLKSQILTSNLRLTTEQHIPVHTPSKILVTYKNISRLQLAAHQISASELKTLNTLYPQEKKLAFIKKLALEKQWESTLKNENDHQEHQTEVLLPELPNGNYILLATPKDATYPSSSFTPIQVTDLALVESRTNELLNFQIINRTNGAPKIGAKLKISYRSSYQSPTETKVLTSDKLGRVSLPLNAKSPNNITAEVSHEGQIAYFKDIYVPKKPMLEEKDTSYPCFLFTDRSIYRPGQTLFFKGIALQRTENTSEILTETEIEVTLKDGNQQVVSVQEFKTNNYGSFSGEFTIPNNTLTGNFSLEATSTEFNLHGYQTISVEEYKRPRFETTFQPITETYQLNDSVLVQGKAVAYAGSTITHAPVKYTVKRIVRSIIWHGQHLPYYQATPQIIAQGTTTTDAKGQFGINFMAIPDLTVPKEQLPVFNYEVTADVTDLNGETRSATTNIKVGYHALTANIEIAELINQKNKKHKITISTQNLNGQATPTQGTIKMYKLKGPDRVLRPRPWAAPDYPGFDKKEFKKRFPHDSFEDESDPSQWPNGELVWEAPFNTENGKTIELNLSKKWASGKYRLELSTSDIFGQDVKDIAYTTLYNPSDKTLADQQLFQIKYDKPSYTIEDQVTLKVSSAAKDLSVTLLVEKERKIVATHLLKLNNTTKTLRIPVTPGDLGGFVIHYSFSFHNAFHTDKLSIPVPHPDRDIQIETVSFRDKIEPGTEETWSFKVTGPKGNGLNAEIMANMYDASLDAFKPHAWYFNPNSHGDYYSNIHLTASKSFQITSFRTITDYAPGDGYIPQRYDSFNWFGLHFGNGHLQRNRIMIKGAAPSELMEEAVESSDQVLTMANEAQTPGEKTGDTPVAMEEDKNIIGFENIQIRKNLQETAFFLPQLHTDKDGNVSFSFTTPEALTQWKVQLLAHTKSLKSAISTLTTVTQKELMVTPNAPRFLREGDQVTFSSKISNQTDLLLAGKAKLELIDAVTGKDIGKELLIAYSDSSAALSTREFKVDGNGNTEVSWVLTIPKGIQAIQYKVMATANNYSDGEQNILPVLSNRTLVTETLPMWINGNQTKSFTMEKLKNPLSPTLRHHRLSLEITSNPVWYAVQALPYLMEYPSENNEQVFSRYYANTLGAHIAQSNARIQEVFSQWANSDALLSNLEKNQELKSILIAETPWLRDAQSESEQKKRIALLFNLNKLKNEQNNSWQKLQQNQMPSGGWAWFNGGPENRFITQHILIGLGHLQKLTSASPSGITSPNPENEEQRPLITKAFEYLDAQFLSEYERLKKYHTDLSKDHLSTTQLHYLYLRSLFPNHAMSEEVASIKEYYLKQALQYWTNKSLYSKGLLSLILYRNNHKEAAKKIIKSLDENSIISEEMGMYWKQNTASWDWNQAPVETQSLLIEAFSEINNNPKQIDLLKLWLLKNKQTHHWTTTKATTKAIYSLLLQGSDWLVDSEAIEVQIGDQHINPATLDNVKIEAGTGYYKTSWDRSEIKPAMATVQLNKKLEGSAWGTLTWQYFEDLDKISFADTPLKLRKKVFLRNHIPTGEELSEVSDTKPLKIGDLVRIRIELQVDRGMEFVHMKDMRASGLEPTTVLSSYQWQDGLGYYQSVKDASVNFFFDYLPKGVYIFEYDLRVNHSGDFSNGITTIQSMYAPEFSSHTEGLRLQVD
ncbi:alpha-2-macroglobulin family protein [Arenibacter lacus]|uniref:alpha-2-macroglobulin family protein n=1 Tax=Arenibacter lacus TaxID=2608629 RepID=UPI00123C96AF|nr:MG2 domain-containing protein [Arenibacter lacus]